jgi:hypothetical protein
VAVKMLRLGGRTWPAVLAVLVLIAVHAVLVGVVFRGDWSVAAGAGLTGLLALTHKVVEFPSRRRRRRGEPTPIRDCQSRSDIEA